MPIEVRKTDNGRGTVIVGSGVVTEEEFIAAHMKKVYVKEMLENRVYSFSDYTNVDNIEFNPQNIKILSQLIANKRDFFSKKVFFAIAGTKDIAFVLSKMWQTFIQNIPELTTIEVEIFRDTDKAKQWLQQQVKKEYNIDITFS